MLKPKSRRIKDYQYCFYGHEIKKQESEDAQVYKTLRSFLSDYNMEIYPLVEAGKWLWPELIKRMERSAFCVFETQTGNRNVHIELGYSLAKNLNVILLVPENEAESGDFRKYLPSDLSGLMQIRYSNIGDLKKKLKTEILRHPHYLSVDERLGMALQSVTDIDLSYFKILINLGNNQTIRFSELVGKARVLNSSSSNTYLADFLRKYDEAIIVGKQVSGMANTQAASLNIFCSVFELDSTPLSVDEEYKEWIRGRLGGI